MVKIALTGIATIICALCVKNGKGEYAAFISMAGCLLLFFLSMTKLDVVLDMIAKVKNYASGSNQYITVLLKITGITYLAEFASDLCKDAGFSALGNQIELAGKVSVMLESLPVLLALIDVIEGFMS